MKLVEFIIIGIDGKPFCDAADVPIVFSSREDAARWMIKGDDVLPYVAPREIKREPVI